MFEAALLLEDVDAFVGEDQRALVLLLGPGILVAVMRKDVLVLVIC